MNNETIKIRYGQSLPLEINIDNDTATSGVLYVGKKGELPRISKPFSVAQPEGIAEILLEQADTRIPLGEYLYQINIVDVNGNVTKFPEPETCDDDCMPRFIVFEALDETEVVS